MKLIKCLVFMSFVSASTAFSADKAFENIGNTLGAFSKIIQTKTKVNSPDEPPEKDLILTPPAEDLYNNLGADLNNCKTTEIVKPVEIEIQQDGSTHTLTKFHILIDGPNCPMSVEASMDTLEAADKKINGIISVKIVINDPTLIQKSKLKNAEMSGIVSFEGAQIGSKISSTTFMKLATKGDSTDIGLFDTEMNMKFVFDMDFSNFQLNTIIEQAGKIKYGNVNMDLASQLKMGSAGASENYTLNGVAISRSEYQQYLQSFIMADAAAQGDSNAPDGRTTTSCSLVIFEKAKVTADQLKAMMTSKSVNKADALLSSEACGKTAQSTFTQNGKTYSQTISFDQDWIKFSSNIMTAQEATSIYLLYKDGVPQTAESDDFTLGIQCQPVSYCP